MNTAISGPDCTNICKGDCCSIEIDIPKILAEEYINQNLAKKKDFTRSNIFTFKLRFDYQSGKCFLFDSKINGCIVHQSGLKPPQCWIYPTKFSVDNVDSNNSLSCKQTSGWEIIKPLDARKAEKILEKYNQYCIEEMKEELKKITERIGTSKSPKRNNLITSLSNIPPSKLGGFIDKWDNFEILNAEGHSLQMKRFCEFYNSECQLIKKNFLECDEICKKIATKLIDFLYSQINIFLNKYDAPPDGKYPLYKLFNQFFIDY
jgi:hypothetical protein